MVVPLVLCGLKLQSTALVLSRRPVKIGTTLEIFQNSQTFFLFVINIVQNTNIHKFIYNAM